MAYYRKNKKRFDPRYFMNERLEKVEEIAIDGPFKKFDVETPGEISKKLNKRKKSDDEKKKIKQSLEDLDSAVQKQATKDARNRKFDAIGMKKEGCGDSPEKYWVRIPGAEVTSSIGGEEGLAELLGIVQNFFNSGIEILDASDEVLERLGLSRGDLPTEQELEE